MFLLVICRDMEMVWGFLRTDIEMGLEMLRPGIEMFLVVLLTGIYSLSIFLGPHCASVLALRKT